VTKHRVAILISGSGSNMAALIDSMTPDHPAKPVLVITNRPGAQGIAKADSRHVKTQTIDHRAFGTDRDAFEEALHNALTKARPDIICLAGFMRVLSAGFVDRWQGRILNIHPSLLPKYPGLHTHARVLAAGDQTHGCTVHEVTGALDAGPVLGQASILVHARDTEADLAARVLEAEHRLYPAVLRRVASGDRTHLSLS